jgi:6-phosphofructokinase 1
LDGSDGILPHIYRLTKEQGYAVAVLAEGAEVWLGRSTAADAGGNRNLPAIGKFMRDQIKQNFTERGEESVVRYVDPSYMVRSVPPVAADTIYCTDIAHAAVHVVARVDKWRHHESSTYRS